MVEGRVSPGRLLVPVEGKVLGISQGVRQVREPVGLGENGLTATSPRSVR